MIDLLQPRRIARGARRFDRGRQLDALARGFRPYQLDDRRADRIEIDRRYLEVHLLLLDARGVEQLVDERPLLTGAPLERLDGPGLAVAIERRRP